METPSELLQTMLRGEGGCAKWELGKAMFGDSNDAIG
jgi:hypothetical protein